jgi:hypothetical protein
VRLEVEKEQGGMEKRRMEVVVNYRSRPRLRKETTR